MISVKTAKDSSDRPALCKYCRKVLQGGTKLQRHLLARHKAEPELRPLLELQKPAGLKGVKLTDEQKRLEFDRIRKVRSFMAKIRAPGDRMYNERAWSEQGTLIVARRPVHKVNPSNYGPCPDCLIYFKITALASHLRKNCKVRLAIKSVAEQPKTSRRQVQMESQLLLPTTVEISTEFREKVVRRLRAGILTGIIVSDKLIIARGEAMYRRHRHIPARLQYIRCKLREIARLCFYVCDRNPDIRNVTEMLDPKNFYTLVESADLTCGLDHETNLYKRPSLALKLGYELKKYSLLLKKGFLIAGNEEGVKKMNNFYEVMKYWEDEVSGFALRTMRLNRAVKPLALPLAEDLVKLHNYLKQERDEAMHQLVVGDQYQSFHRLSKILMCQILLFNRKRACEVQCIKLNSYVNRAQTHETHDEVLKLLTDAERRLVNKLVLIRTEGKNEQPVPVLLTENHVASLTALLNVRQHHVESSNPYLFPDTSSKKHHSVARALRQYCNNAKLECPSFITSRSLRRHVATMAQLLALGEQGVEGLARFMSHTGSVHANFYRLPEDTMILAKTSKILYAMEAGVSKYAGKTLAEIDPECEEMDINVELPSDEDESAEDDIHSQTLLVDEEDPDVNDETWGDSDEEDLAVTIPKKTRPTSTPRYQNKSKGRRLDWTEQQKTAIDAYFKSDLRNKKFPPTHKIKNLKTEQAIFHNKSIENIRNYVNNKIRSLLKH